MRRRLVLLVATIAVGMPPLVLVGLSAASAGADDVPLPSFNGSASAIAARMTLTAPGATVTDTPVDGGGPTAQAVATSIGAAQGYAAFPDPGALLVSAPGLASGLLAAGAGGLPPLPIGSLPDYPFAVSSDPTANPDVKVGSGPYFLEASSRQGRASAHSATGVETGFAGLGTADSKASVGPAEDGSAVVASAISEVSGISIGPLKIGDVLATATQTIASDGTVTPRSDLSIAGMYVGNSPVKVGPQGFNAAGQTHELDMNSGLADLLKASGITVSIVPAAHYDASGTVISPALQISFPFAMPIEIPNVGQYSGTVTMTIGSAVAQMTGAGSGATGAAVGGALGSTNGTAGPGSGVDAVAVPTTPGEVNATTGGTLPSTVATVPAAAGAAQPLVPAPLSAEQVSERIGLDARHSYLLIVVGLVFTGSVGAVLRRLR
jgi:hypothetical protein